MELSCICAATPFFYSFLFGKIKNEVISVDENKEGCAKQKKCEEILKELVAFCILRIKRKSGRISTSQNTGGCKRWLLRWTLVISTLPVRLVRPGLLLPVLLSQCTARWALLRQCPFLLRYPYDCASCCTWDELACCGFSNVLINACTVKLGLCFRFVYW